MKITKRFNSYNSFSYFSLKEDEITTSDDSSGEVKEQMMHYYTKCLEKFLPYLIKIKIWLKRKNYIERRVNFLWSGRESLKVS